MQFPRNLMIPQDHPGEGRTIKIPTSGKTGQKWGILLFFGSG
jgi:hypothetical protein